ncbi:bifunctional serine/threonine-protein kinase/glutamate ABC transporter substrate-binding protein [Streptosporangium sp. NPDC051022]|uniref:bifunctional serine/threonine-protein kinase/glutamate ABC transporter substrate-binding protein n=1 Tax=Streptosporangium sp. NPDC051022 TaxID=3155752 RepID=UPI003442845E
MPEIRPLRPGDPPRLGDYTLKGRLGEGGQGVVYLGESEDGERAAVKLLHVRFTGEDHARSRFARELAAAGRVAAFCTARVLGADLDGETPYIASELIDGPSLRHVVEREGPLSGEKLERLAIGTITALTAIHRAGIAHRDFKPDNVLLAADGPRVVDFGIAKIIDESGTITTRAVGTPAYMAPEQISDEDVGFPADVFAWGSTMIFTATGRAPFAGDTIVATLNRVINQEADLSALPGGLREIVGLCLSKDQALRPTADEVLKRLLGHPADEAEASAEELAEGVQAATIDLTRPGRPAPVRRRRALAAGLVVLGVAAAAFLVVQFAPLPSRGAASSSPRAVSPSPTPTPTPTPSTGSALLDRIRAKHVIRVGYRDGLPGVSLGRPPRGFEADVAEYVARALGVPEGGVRFVPVRLGDRETAVERGEVDLVIANFSIDDASRERVAFAGPYYVAHRDVLVRQGARISKLRHLNGRTVCVSPGLTTAAMIRDRGVGFVPLEEEDMSRCATRVADGTADALPGDDLVLAGFGARLPGAGLKIAGLRLTSERYGVALRRGDPVACRAINEAIGSMYEDGTLKRLLSRHFGRVDFRSETGTPRLEHCR